MRDIVIEPATAARWHHVLELFGESGAYSNCWCTWWLLTGRDWDAASPRERREILRQKVADSHEPGLLAFRDGSPVGWCAVGPRNWYDRLNSPRARVYKRIDDLDTWVINCFFIRRDRRGTGIATALLDAAIEHAWSRGAPIIEGYPIDDAVRRSDAAGLFVGTLSMFRAAGFEEVARVNDRPLVRLLPA